ncbi:Pet127-domain-containing protein [Polyplosphaeria fusca]|uniref:Pet127-domain-containing protein n=1 Tax=Polyplosphaeria fusca TaxID=682080 RepID=A0A9P4R390_9PLEO|nr:Pet127-domain-containing protein [Polyplosphaeria fusca]
MLNRLLPRASPSAAICVFCSARNAVLHSQIRALRTSHKPKPANERRASRRKGKSALVIRRVQSKTNAPISPSAKPPSKDTAGPVQGYAAQEHTRSLKEALLESVKQEGKAKARETKPEKGGKGDRKPQKKKAPRDPTKNIPIEILQPAELAFESVDAEIPPIPKLAHGLDRVLFNPGVYRLQDPRSRIYNFDPYLEKVMPVSEFDFDALSEYKTSSRDEDLLAITRKLGTKFTGSTSSMSSVLQHFHFLLSNWRELNHQGLSRTFPKASKNFSKITTAPSAIFLRWKDGIYAVDADKSSDTPNIMSWLGHSMEKLLTNSRDEFERYRRSSYERPPDEDESGKCFHYSRIGNFLVRSQLDAHDPRLPGTGVFDLKTRAVVTIRMNAQEYEEGQGYQLRYDQGEWESFEREYYDMTRATMLKYSLQVRMGRMDGIFVAFHNIERIFGFQYVSLPDMDRVLHEQTDTTLGDQEFKLSISLLDEVLQRATQKFPETSIRLFFETRPSKGVPYMYIFAEPVTEEDADAIQNTNLPAQKAFARNIVGVKRDDPEVQAEWQDLEEQIDVEVSEDEDKDHDIKQSDKEQREDTKDSGTVATRTEDEEHEEKEGREKEEGNGDEKPRAEPTSEDSQPTDDKPLMAWTLTVRNRVNGEYVLRPTDFTADDTWSLEYHLKEIDPQQNPHKLYRQLRERRFRLVGMSEEDRSKQLKTYRQMLRTYSDKGRAWREQQDKLDAEKGQQVYRPFGPGAEPVEQAPLTTTPPAADTA